MKKSNTNPSPFLVFGPSNWLTPILFNLHNLNRKKVPQYFLNKPITPIKN